jgi:transcriptional regulator with GAF, ATPase, and Fis domain
VPVVRAAFSSAGRLATSVRGLLEQGRRIGERKAYVLAVSSSLVEAVAARFGARHEVEAADVPNPARVRELMDPEEVPADLEAHLTGSSAEMHFVRQQVVRASREDYPVLIQGDTGTGKEVTARWIHRLHRGDVQRHPFVAVNCGAIPEDLFEAEVFGYVPGAFTGALRHGHDGLWRSAKDGTIFLDEIGDLAPAHQVKILRALEQREVRPVGSSKEIPVQARVIAASNRDIYQMTEQGEFREDLYYRLASFVIRLPPLRDRPEDIERLARLFWAEVAPRRPPLSTEVIQELRRYRWRGNAREVRYIMVSLHMTFPKSPPTVERLRAVVHMRASAEESGSATGPEAALHRVDYLRRLRRALAIVDAARHVARSFRRRDLDEAGRVRALTNVGGCLEELQLLAARPDHFDDVGTFAVIHRLAGGLAAFQNLLLREDPQAWRFCKKELVGEADAALAAVRHEEQRTLKAL